MKSIKVIFAPAHIDALVLPSRIDPEKLMESLLGGKHFAYLGDGSLEIKSTIEDDTVSVSLRCTPHLDVQYMHFKTVEMTKEQYLSAWQNLMRQILKHLS